MNLLRSSLFMLVMVPSLVLVVALLLLLFWLPLRSRRLLVMPWVRFVMWLTEHLLGIRMRIIGAENVPAGPCVILAKHQSAWETFALQLIFPLTSFVYKRELNWLPFFGWGMKLMPFVAIDRTSGKAALKQVIERGKQRLAEGYSVVVFPEGTRVAPGQRRDFKIGGAMLAVAAKVPAVPVAHNSGECWPRKAFIKRPGIVTVSIGTPIDTAGRNAGEVNALAEAWIEAEMRRISPHLYRDAEARPATETAA
ncbi:MAG: lysophospholipid acyltransferase family protein [Rhodocyclaceae bacterium]|uniref:lysophospholipid acyltransferase family protein n=1 Tax=Sulfuricystis thermophila TaxID=2496847 RepID=UPI0010359576|nr:lysophospholipid acyltransferase family protein [Sulfuricystis thermophila]MDI6749558.1 lysophospholipid acyltransferase family protein [Rhodocyclaceae bacterium]